MVRCSLWDGWQFRWRWEPIPQVSGKWRQRGGSNDARLTTITKLPQGSLENSLKVRDSKISFMWNLIKIIHGTSYLVFVLKRGIFDVISRPVFHSKSYLFMSRFQYRLFTRFSKPVGIWKTHTLYFLICEVLGMYVRGTKNVLHDEIFHSKFIWGWSVAPGGSPKRGVRSKNSQGSPLGLRRGAKKMCQGGSIAFFCEDQI